jgi:hypothetical protein
MTFDCKSGGVAYDYVMGTPGCRVDGTGALFGRTLVVRRSWMRLSDRRLILEAEATENRLQS